MNRDKNEELNYTSFCCYQAESEAHVIIPSGWIAATPIGTVAKFGTLRPTASTKATIKTFSNIFACAVEVIMPYRFVIDPNFTTVVRSDGNGAQYL